MKTVEECLTQILDFFHPLGVEKVPLKETLHRVLAEDIYSSRSIPPHDNSAMDGYALKGEDLRKASKEHPVRLRSVEEIPAGRAPERSIGSGETSRIMTGAPIPTGADTVVKIEDVEIAGGEVSFFAPAAEGENIRRRGEDVVEGECVIAAGTLIGPAHMGMLAATGNALVPVFQKPLVAVIATGDELIDVDGDPSSGGVVTSNSYSLYGQIIEAGGIPLPLGIARDNRDDLLAHFSEAKERAHVIISSGGVSMGDYDFVQDVFTELGARVLFDTVAQRPGKPFTYATMGEIPFFGLPGNPVSAMMSFEQYVRPSLLKMTGHRTIFRRTIKAVLEDTFVKRGDLTYFVRGIVTWRDGKFTVVTTGDQGSGILKSMVLANGIIVLPRNMTTARRGEEVTVQLIDNGLLTSMKPDYLDYSS
ncbi:MAG: molybdopterin molybdotransferase MoeA [Syntrophales bacterium]|jgi:molybdopterin molybdotransferase|nr:molybdopterin molybdotransferase MoeA [Syntrophales bacterium]MDX9922426.1 molybdopterin molybdotransferase MoeA [Syntrophales bacterium]